MIARGPSFYGGAQATTAKPRPAAKSLTGKSPLSGTQGTDNLSALGWGGMPHKYDKLSHTKTQSPNNTHLLFSNMQRRSLPDNIAAWRKAKHTGGQDLADIMKDNDDEIPVSIARVRLVSMKSVRDNDECSKTISKAESEFVECTETMVDDSNAYCWDMTSLIGMNINLK